MTKPYTFTQPRRPQEFKEAQIQKAIQKSGGVYAAPKADGVRLQIIVAPDASKVYIRSREDKPFRGLADIEEALNSPFMQDLRVDNAGWTIEAEAVLRDSLGNHCPCAVTSGALQAKEQVRTGQLVLFLFDAHHPTLTAGLDLKDRSKFINYTYNARRLLYPVSYHVFSLLPLEVESMEALKAHYELVRRNNFEGLVITPIGVPYASGKNAKAGWKMKPEETKEATITGLIEAVSEEGKPKYMIGSFEVTYEDGTTGKVGAGRMPHLERAYYWAHQEEIKGRLIEVSSMETNETGGQRHPVFKMFRDTPEFKGVKI